MTSLSQEWGIFPFNIKLDSTNDKNRMLVSNVSRVIVKKLVVKVEGNEILSIDDFNVLACYRDLWKTKSEKKNAVRQRIISNDRCTENCIKLRIDDKDKSASSAQDKCYCWNIHAQVYYPP